MNIRTMRYALAATLGAIGINPVALAACIGPIGADERPSAWTDVRDHVPTPILGASVLAIGAATGEINNDFYAITIDSAGQTPAQLAKELRSDFNAIVFTGAPDQSFRAYDAANAAIWRRDDPMGAVMTFVLAKTFGAEIEKGSVLVSCTSATDWIFSTVATANDGLHPVSGNRGFGVVRNADGSLTIFTKAADRATNAFFGASGVFQEGHAVWLRFIGNLRQRYRDRNPRDQKVISRRIAFS